MGHVTQNGRTSAYPEGEVYLRPREKLDRKKTWLHEKMNPKVTLIIGETFPKIIERHIRTRPTVESTQKSLDSYRRMGYASVKNLSPEERELNEKALDTAYAASMQQLHDFHACEKSHSGTMEGTGKETV